MDRITAIEARLASFLENSYQSEPAGGADLILVFSAEGRYYGCRDFGTTTSTTGDVSVIGDTATFSQTARTTRNSAPLFSMPGFFLAADPTNDIALPISCE
jgi:hypothetical protein